MAEAIAVAGFVAAIIQISSFAKKLVDRCNAFHSRSKDVPKTFRGISIQLPLVVTSLEQIRGQAESGALGKDSLLSLQPVVEACDEEVKDLEAILNKILPAPDASAWDRNALALKSLGYEAEVKKVVANISGHVQYLTLFQASLAASHVLRQLRNDGEPREVELLIEYRFRDIMLINYSSLPFRDKSYG